jgi:long-subunit acyl-CoA synthetase (AMP-forming)
VSQETSPSPGETVAETLRNAFEYYGNKPCLGIRDVGSPLHWKWYSYTQTFEMMVRFGKSLRELIPERSVVGICAEDRLEWFIADYGCVSH